MAISFCFYLTVSWKYCPKTTSGSKTYTEWFCRYKLQTQLQTASEGSNIDITKLKRSVFGPYFIQKSSKKWENKKNVATTTLIIIWPLVVPTEVKTVLDQARIILKTGLNVKKYYVLKIAPKTQLSCLLRLFFMYFGNKEINISELYTDILVIDIDLISLINVITICC